MHYLGHRDLQAMGLDWGAVADLVEDAVRLVDAGDCAQPVKPYLRYNDPVNRIIAMPAYAGGGIKAAGIKWIASFPGNIRLGLPRAHCVIVLNDPDTGVPVACLNSPLPSIVRTASVSGVMIRHYLHARPLDRIELGIIGWGPIGQFHARMAMALFGERIERIHLYDIRGVDLEDMPNEMRERTAVAASWQDVYAAADIFITCTVSDHRYIDGPPNKGSLLLNVSLRDYQPDAVAPLQAVIVDDWDEVCRENTDIERLHLERGLARKDTRSLADVVCRGCLSELSADEPVFFNPMGMAVFDIATAVYYVRQARARGIGTVLD